MAYFTIYNGLNGYYMPDSAYITRANTRKELKATLQWEADSIRDAGGIGMNKRAIAWLANAAWKARKRTDDLVVPYRWAYQNRSCPYVLGVFTGASRKEYFAQDN